MAHNKPFSKIAFVHWLGQRRDPLLDCRQIAAVILANFFEDVHFFRKNNK